MTVRLLHLRQSPKVLRRRIVDSVLLSGPDSGDVYELDATSSVIWDQLAAPVAMDDLVANVADLYGTFADGIRHHVQRVVDELLHNRLIDEICISDG